VSQHLRVLREADLVNVEKRGYWMHYSAKKEKVEQFIKKFNNLLGGEKNVQEDKEKRVRTSRKIKGKARRM
jgi:DNA-binding transcriptional ArsR family regulator